MDVIILLLSIAILILAILCCFLLFYYFKINKSISLFLEKGNIKDAREVLFSQVEKTKQIDVQLQEFAGRLASLESLSKIAIQKIGVVRFNPFGDIGGNQSFAIAFLDNYNNGFVISSLFVKEGNRVYAKSVVNGVSEHTLSAEEKEAITRATAREIPNLKSNPPAGGPNKS